MTSLMLIICSALAPLYFTKWSHAVDLWSMEAVIIYLTLRIIALAVFVLISNLTDGLVIASFVSSTLCLAMYLGHIYDNALRWYKKHTSRFWQDLCPFAVRNRLPNSPYVLGRTESKTEKLKPIWMIEVYIFALLPVFSNVLNWILIKTIFHTVGSSILVRILNRSLVFAWTYRLFERWGFDGCWIVSHCESKIQESKDNNLLAAFWTTSAAVLSPTSVLHFWTGITLLSAYCHSRSIEIFILSNISR